MVIDGETLFKQSQQLIEKGEKYDIALEGLYRLLDETLHGTGEVAHILFYIGCVHMKRNELAMAIIVFRQAVKHKSQFIEAINNLGYIYKEACLFDEAKKCFVEVMRITDENPTAISDKDKSDYNTNIGSMYIQNGTPEIALEYFNKAIEYKDCGNVAKWNKALSLLELGQWEEGFKFYDFGERIARTKDRSYGKAGLKEWCGPEEGKKPTVVIYGEQGIGDEIMFASIIPDAMKDANVIIDCHPRLIDLFRVNFPGVPVYGTRKQKDSDTTWPEFHKIDYKVSMGSLGKFYRKKDQDFPKVPYFNGESKFIDKYAEKLKAMGNRPKIGFSWQGGVRSTGVSHRYIPLDLWLDIFKLDADFISLQYNKGLEEEVSVFEKQHDVKLNHWPETLEDYDETAGLVANLDLIISVPQSVVHLAGAMGKFTWQLTPVESLWQCGPYGKNAPWYVSTHNYWQDKDKRRDWEHVLERVYGDLKELINATN